MTEADLAQFETELQRLHPAPPPAELQTRLRLAGHGLSLGRTALARPERAREGGDLPPVVVRHGQRDGSMLARWKVAFTLRWLLPASAVAAVAAVCWRLSVPDPQPPERRIGPSPAPALRADTVDVARQLISTFDTVASLPDGLPVRFRCRAWVDEVVVRDHSRGLEVKQRTPRIEAVPVRFETY